MVVTSRLSLAQLVDTLFLSGRQTHSTRLLTHFIHLGLVPLLTAESHQTIAVGRLVLATRRCLSLPSMTKRCRAVEMDIKGVVIGQLQYGDLSEGWMLDIPKEEARSLQDWRLH